MSDRTSRPSSGAGPPGPSPGSSRRSSPGAPHAQGDSAARSGLPGATHSGAGPSGAGPSGAGPSGGAASAGAPLPPPTAPQNGFRPGTGAAGTGSYVAPRPGASAGYGDIPPASSNGRPPSGRRPLLPLADFGRVVGSLPGVARLAAGSAFNTAEWSLAQTLNLSRRLITATHDADEMVALAHELGVAVNVVGTVAQSVAVGVPLAEALDRAGHAYGEGGQLQTHRDDARRNLRTAGETLLAESRDVWRSQAGHPAYQKIVAELTPDEARILMLLVRKGPQASVDIHKGGLMAHINPEVIATGLTMIGPRAGCRLQGAVPSYLNNLYRLGLLERSDERLPDPAPYQILEVQPDVLDAIHAMRFTKSVRRSIHLTPFGRDFCLAVFGETAVTKPALSPTAATGS